MVKMKETKKVDFLGVWCFQIVQMFDIVFIIIIVIDLTYSKTILETTVEIEPQPAALDFKNLSIF